MTSATTGDRERTPPELPGSLALEPTSCCICRGRDSEPVGLGEDFEYRTSPDTFLAVRCPRCSVVYLDPRPATAELDRIYPDHYHAFQFEEEGFGLIYRVRRRLEARRLLSVCRDLPDGARILDVGCGDGFHLRLLADFGKPSWRLEGVDRDRRAVAMARKRGLEVHEGSLEELPADAARYDLVLLIMVVEHVEDPGGLFAEVARRLAPGGRLLVVTDNTGSLDFRLFGRRHWGGYHFPRHFHLFDQPSMARLAALAGLDVEALGTDMSPVNWVYSVRNALDDFGAPRWLVELFSLRSPLALAAGTLWDTLHVMIGRGALIRAILRRPPQATSLATSLATAVPT